jgi:hypothetical protein
VLPRQCVSLTTFSYPLKQTMTGQPHVASFTPGRGVEGKTTDVKNLLKFMAGPETGFPHWTQSFHSFSLFFPFFFFFFSCRVGDFVTGSIASYGHISAM